MTWHILSIYQFDIRKLALPAAGAIIIEWNVKEPDDVQAGAGMWDSHIRYSVQQNKMSWADWSQNLSFTFLRLGGSKQSCLVYRILIVTLNLGAGTNLDSSNCATNVTGSYDPCYAAFLSLHLTPDSTGYFEVSSNFCSVSIQSKLHFLSGYLDLACGPWLGYSWTKADIYLFWPWYPFRILRTGMDDWHWYVANPSHSADSYFSSWQRVCVSSLQLFTDLVPHD